MERQNVALEHKQLEARQLLETLDHKNREIGQARDQLEDANGSLRTYNQDLEKFQTASLNMMRDMEIARETAECAARAKSDFLANMSHELRTPMNGVIGMTDLLLESGLTEGQSEYAEIVRASGSALLDLINDILDFSKIEAGKLELEEIPFNIERLVEVAGDILAIRAQSKSLEFVVNIHDDVSECVLGDPVRLRQVLINLGNNAIKFTESGEVQISVRASDRPDEIRIDVIDTGIGIPADRMNRLFQSFSQVDASTARKYGGTGLGLAISKRLVEAMGGVVEVDSEVGKGTDFHFSCRLPATDSSALKDPVRSGSLESGLRVLIVDDNATNRLYLREVFQHWRCDSVEAHGGNRALEILEGHDHQNEPFDLILLDYQMPGMNGTDLSRRIRELPECSTVPMVLLTSIHHNEADEWKAAGITLCLTKPIKKSYLLGAINRAIHGDSEEGRGYGLRSGGTAKDSNMDGAVLLVEDNIVNQKVALAMLRRRGLTADVARNGHEAVTAFREKIQLDSHGLPDARDGRV
jgi:two-component system sensor histidine kinase/response regulator